jgi:hypothetical protein
MTKFSTPFKSGFIQIENQLLDYLSDQWPSLYAYLVPLHDGGIPARDPVKGYAWMTSEALEHIKDQWPTAYDMMMCRASKVPAIITDETQFHQELA